jgi:hypothetical protein
MFATPLRHDLRHARPNRLSGNMNQHRFHLIGGGLIFPACADASAGRDNPLILKVFG